MPTVAPWFNRLQRWLQRRLLNDNDAMAAYRQRIAMPVGISGILLLLPFAINNVVQGRPLVALAIALVVLVLGVDVLALRRGRQPPIHYGLIVMPAIAAMLSAVWLQGVYGALWGYPVVLTCYFVMSRRLALLSSIGVLLTLSLMVSWVVSPLLGIRVFATLALTIGMVNVVLNVLADLQKALLEQAITDPLTGAFNRRHMQLSLEHWVEVGRRQRRANGLLIIDIDHFKSINDGHGHEVGDAVLRELVRLINTYKRRSDLLFRMGGEEFLLLLLECPAELALGVAEALRTRIADADMPGALKVTISVGLAMQVPQESATDWLRRADTALYRAKQGGRNRVVAANADGFVNTV